MSIDYAAIRQQIGRQKRNLQPGDTIEGRLAKVDVAVNAFGNKAMQYWLTGDPLPRWANGPLFDEWERAAPQIGDTVRISRGADLPATGNNAFGRSSWTVEVLGAQPPAAPSTPDSEKPARAQQVPAW